MQCARCQHQNRHGARFCDACGVRLAVSCAACGYANRPAARFCIVLSPLRRVSVQAPRPRLLDKGDE